MSSTKFQLLSWRKLQPMISVSRTTWWRLIRAGKAPRPIQVSPGRVAWLESDVIAWLEVRRAV
ncbi:MAG: AlpA family phage regulatory protein [Phenylobacterium sp.]|nr:AlpA family phage regulatory protein [Phenylobacterium sp.]